MDRALQANVIAKSGKAVETAGDVDILLLDKTGTITIGNQSHEFLCCRRNRRKSFHSICYANSMADKPSKSIVELSGINLATISVNQPVFIASPPKPVVIGVYDHTDPEGSI
jgi:K+-transporting ATPase ATPase B chain